jgi:hypothetical protein
LPTSTECKTWLPHIAGAYYIFCRMPKRVRFDAPLILRSMQLCQDCQGGLQRQSEVIAGLQKASDHESAMNTANRAISLAPISCIRFAFMKSVLGPGATLKNVKEVERACRGCRICIHHRMTCESGYGNESNALSFKAFEDALPISSRSRAPMHRTSTSGIARLLTPGYILRSLPAIPSASRSE